MIGHGKYNDVYLYEVTEQDLLFNKEASKTYCVGNVLMFADKRVIDLGHELARAEDLAAAREYLVQEDDQGDASECEDQSKLAALTSRLALQDEALRSLTKKIEQRDELLRDLSESLTAQKQDNSLLQTQLEQARTQLAVDELKHNEMVDDLEYASKETHTIGSTLERVMDEKFRIQQELAERITELVELNLQNDDLKRQLLKPAQATEAPPLAEPAMRAESSTATPADLCETTPSSSDSKVLTMASGKKIHVLHEFPTAPKPGPVVSFGRILVSVARVTIITLFALLVLGTASVITTAQVNSLSYGAALDLIMRSVDLS
jgi:hypothetical protein